MKKIALIFFSLLLFPSLYAQIKKEVLFLGNSYTYVNNLPQLIAFIAASKGDTLIYDSYTPGGYTFQLHSTDPTAINKINSRKWDYVVLQEQSQRPSFSPEQVQILVYPFADTINSLIKINDTCTITTFFMTWGRKNGDAEYCPTYPPVCTFNGMQSRLRQSYLEMGQMFNANVAPVGIVWKKTKEFHPEIELYEPDESHPSLTGSYLAACAFYASLFHKNPIGCYIPVGVDSLQAQIIQNYSSQIVFDSLIVWNIDTTSVNASFTYSAFQNGRVEFINTSRNATDFLWNFGDGDTSIERNPIHTYQICGTTYQVSLNAFKGCEKDISLKEILVPCSGIDEITPGKLVKFYPNPANTQINIEFIDALASFNYSFTLYDALGRIVIIICNEKNSNLINLPKLNNGIYSILLNINGRLINDKIQIIQHN